MDATLDLDEHSATASNIYVCIMAKNTTALNSRKHCCVDEKKLIPS